MHVQLSVKHVHVEIKRDQVLHPHAGNKKLKKSSLIVIGLIPIVVLEKTNSA
jgi:hypothetical protein